MKEICPAEDGAPIRYYDESGMGRFLFGILNFIGDECVKRPGLFLDVDGKILKNVPDRLFDYYDIIPDWVESEFRLESEQIFEIMSKTIEDCRIPTNCEINHDCPLHLVSI